MGFDLFRYDNRTAARFDDDVYFRATARAWPLIVQALAAVAIADALEAVVRATRAALADLDDDERARLDFVERFARFSRTAAPHGGYEVR